MKIGRVHQRKITDNGGCSSYLFLAAISLTICLISADGLNAEVQHASSGLKIELGENWRGMSKNIPVKFTPMPTFSGSHDFQEPSQLLWRPAEAGSPLTKAAYSGDKEEVGRLLAGGPSSRRTPLIKLVTRVRAEATATPCFLVSCLAWL